MAFARLRHNDELTHAETLLSTKIVCGGKETQDELGERFSHDAGVTNVRQFHALENKLSVKCRTQTRQELELGVCVLMKFYEILSK